MNTTFNSVSSKPSGSVGTNYTVVRNMVNHNTLTMCLFLFSSPLSISGWAMTTSMGLRKVISMFLDKNISNRIWASIVDARHIILTGSTTSLIQMPARYPYVEPFIKGKQKIYAS